MTQPRTSVLIVALIAAAAASAVSAAELTPAGAERSANKDGSIPEWHGTESQQSGWSYGKLRGDHWKYRTDKPRLSIDASNVDKFADKLSPGQVAVLKQVPGYKMDVYPTRRSCGIPDFVADNTRKNVSAAKIAPDGWSLQEAMVPGFPFAEPKSGIEAMWNMKMRYRGVGVEYKSAVSTVSPRKGGTEWIRAMNEQTLFYPWAVKGSTQLSKLPPIEYFTYFGYNAPAALAGQAAIITYFLNQPSAETFYYFPGQRRVRRMPSYAYDSPQIGFENQYTLDEPMVFNGTLDRFDWKLAGKKELYVPYNSFGAYDFKATTEDIAQPNFINPTHRRYELHRVWVVEATVKPGNRHSAPKRTYYIDEDSWNLVLAEDYDAQGKLAKVREGFLIPVYETGTCDTMAFVQFNLAEGRYVFDMHAAATGKDIAWIVEPNNPKLKAQFYTSDNLRAISDR